MILTKSQYNKICQFLVVDIGIACTFLGDHSWEDQM